MVLDSSHGTDENVVGIERWYKKRRLGVHSQGELANSRDMAPEDV